LYCVNDIYFCVLSWQKNVLNGILVLIKPDPGSMKRIFSVSAYNKANIATVDVSWRHTYEYIQAHHANLVLSGKGYIELDGKVRELKKGKLYIFPTNAVYTHYRDESDNPFTVLWFIFKMTPDYKGGLIELDPQKDEIVKSIVTLIHNLVLTEEVRYSRVNNLIYELMNHVLRTHENISLYSDKRISKSLQYIKKNYNKPVTLSELASLSGLSEAHYSRVFKDVMGLSPIQFVIQEKMQKAVEILITGTSVSETAASVGYFNNSLFVKTFKSVYQCTPTQFLKNKFRFD
jgi:AraC-like DNA-binding protein